MWLNALSICTIRIIRPFKLFKWKAKRSELLNVPPKNLDQVRIRSVFAVLIETHLYQVYILLYFICFYSFSEESVTSDTGGTSNKVTESGVGGVEGSEKNWVSDDDEVCCSDTQGYIWIDVQITPQIPFY